MSSYFEAFLLLAILPYYCKSSDMTFLGNMESSFAIYKDWDGSITGSLSFDFKTGNENGLLLHIQGNSSGFRNKHYLLLTITEGELTLTMNMGDISESSVSLGSHLNDLRWHHVEIVRNYRISTLILDGMQNILASNLVQGKHELKIVASLLYVGGIPKNGPSLDGILWSAQGFVGCIRNIRYGDCGSSYRDGKLSRSGNETRIGCINACKNKLQHCQHGGKCVNRFTSYSCHCAETGYDGKTCDQKSKVLFMRNESFITMPTKNLQYNMSNRFQARFKSTANSGILVAIGKRRDYQLLEISEGYLRLETDIGGGKMETRSEKKVNDGNWHSIDVWQKGEYISFIMDKGRYKNVTKSPNGFTKANCDDNEKIYFGGHFNEGNVLGSKSKTGFTGCLQQMYFNGIDIVSSALKIVKNKYPSLDMRVDGSISDQCPDFESKIIKPKDPKMLKDASSMDTDPVPQGGPSHGILDKKKMNAPPKDKNDKGIFNKSSIAGIAVGIMLGLALILISTGVIVYHLRHKYCGKFIASQNGDTARNSLQHSLREVDPFGGSLKVASHARQHVTYFTNSGSPNINITRPDDPGTSV